ncbi:TRAP transporter substrate-binding protein, partial [Clostridium cadaveris]
MQILKKTGKRIFALAVSVMMTFTAVGCGVSTSGKSDKVVFRMAIVDGETSPIYKGAKAMADKVFEKTDGKVEIVVVTGGALGDERGSVELAMQGDLDIASAANSVLTNWIPEMDILDQAYLWTNKDQAHAAVDGELGDLIDKAAEEKLGVHVIGYLESGFRDTFAKKPIENVDDFKGVKIRTMQNKYHMAAFQSFGAMPTAMAYNEVFTALQQGTIDACENAVSNCLSNGYYEVTKHVTFT